MVNSCCAYDCRNQWFPSRNILFHRFPFKRPDILKLWIKAIRRKDWTPSKCTVICSDHFTMNDYNNPNEKRLLKKDAVPSIFNYPKHLQKQTKPTRRPIVYRAKEPKIIDNTDNTTCNSSNNQTIQPISRTNTPNNVCESSKNQTVGVPVQAIIRNAPTKTVCKDVAIQTSRDVGVQTIGNIFLSESAAYLRMKQNLKNLRQQLKRRDIRIAYMKRMIKYLRSSYKPSDDIAQILIVE